jgi:hypothetical protein
MFPNYTGSHRFLAQDDIDGIQEIYGPPLSLGVYITGPRFVRSEEPNTWTAQVSNNEGPVTYKWFRRSFQGPFYFYGGTNMSYTDSFTNYRSETIDGAVKVEVTSAGETATHILEVQVFPGCNGPSSARKDSATTRIPGPCN